MRALPIRPDPDPALARRLPTTALAAVGGELPVGVREFARRAYAQALDPLQNPVKQVMDAATSPLDVAPMLGIFNDIPVSKMRETEVMAWARAGFLFVVNDGEHSLLGGRMMHEQNVMQLRCGITPIQRLHREAVSEHGDSLVLGARGTMRPYISTVEEVDEYCRAITYPTPGSATPADRGGFPVRLGDMQMTATPDLTRAAESETQGWVMFETAELLGVEGTQVRDEALDRMRAQGRNRTAGFVGAFDAGMRGGASDELTAAISALPSAAAARGICVGRLCGTEDAMVEALQQGYRLIGVTFPTSELPYVGAAAAAAPFFAACERVGLPTRVAEDPLHTVAEAEPCSGGEARQ